MIIIYICICIYFHFFIYIPKHRPKNQAPRHRDLQLQPGALPAAVHKPLRQRGAGQLNSASASGKDGASAATITKTDYKNHGDSNKKQDDHGRHAKKDKTDRKKLGDDIMLGELRDTYTDMYIYIYIYFFCICICDCALCVLPPLWYPAPSHHHRRRRGSLYFLYGSFKNFCIINL